MSFLVNTITSDGVNNIKEDLSNLMYIYNTTECPIFTMAKRGKATNRTHEWLNDSLDPPVDNPQTEGNVNVAADSVINNVRQSNYTQILRKDISVSGTMQAVNLAGMKDELLYQSLKRAKEVRRNTEVNLSGAAIAQNNTGGSVPRKSAGLSSFLATNWYDPSTGSKVKSAPTFSQANLNGFPQTAAVSSNVAITFTSVHLEACITNIVAITGSIDGYTLLMNQFQRTQFNGFGNKVTPMQDLSAKEQVAIHNSAALYTSATGTITARMDVFMPQDRAYLFPNSLLQVSWLRPIQTTPLARVGDAYQSMVLGEYCLRVNGQQAAGQITGLTTQ